MKSWRARCQVSRPALSAYQLQPCSMPMLKLSPVPFMYALVTVLKNPSSPQKVPQEFRTILRQARLTVHTAPADNAFKGANHATCFFVCSSKAVSFRHAVQIHANQQSFSGQDGRKMKLVGSHFQASSLASASQGLRGNSPTSTLFHPPFPSPPH